MGLILDARGRPLSFFDDSTANLEIMNDWVRKLGLYPKVDIPIYDKDPDTGSVETSKKAQAYTPGLEVSKRTTIECRRVLPITGNVLVKKGDNVESVIIAIDVEKERIALGIKQLTPDPNPDDKKEEIKKEIKPKKDTEKNTKAKTTTKKKKAVEDIENAGTTNLGALLKAKLDDGKDD